MDRPASGPLLDHFSALKDSRQQAKVLHPLPEIVLLLLCGTLAGADAFFEIALWGGEHLAFLRRFLPYRHGIPSHDTLGEAVAALDPELFKGCFTRWVEGLREAEPDLVAVDGKTSRRTHARGKGRDPLHLVSARASRQRLVLGREAVAGKSNEIAAIPPLLERLALEGALVTIDAIGTQRAIAGTILRRGGDYLLALKANRPATFEDVEAFGACPPARGAGPGGRPAAGFARHLRDHRRRARPDRGPAARGLPRRGLAVLGPALPGRGRLPGPGHDRHGREHDRARRRGLARAALLSGLRARRGHGPPAAGRRRRRARGRGRRPWPR